jgi:hypothetical protein
MKRIIFLLLIACSTFTSGYAQQQWRRGRVLVQNPDNVIKVLENIINDCEEHKTTTYSVTKDPNTGVVESSVRVIHFKSWMDYDRMEDIEKAFQKDEPKSYQLVHVVPGNTGNKKFINVPVCSESGIEYIDIRSNLKQETWMMCTKNTTNPKLRDVYAISWKMNAKDKAEGDIFYITSMRPDLYEKLYAKKLADNSDSTNNSPSLTIVKPTGTTTIYAPEGSTFTPADEGTKKHMEFLSRLTPEDREKLMMFEQKLDANEKAYKSLKRSFSDKMEEADIKVLVDKVIDNIDERNKYIDESLKVFESRNVSVQTEVEIVNEALVKEFVNFKTRLDKNYDQVAASKSLMRLHDYLTKQIKKNTSKVEKLLNKAKQQ